MDKQTKLIIALISIILILGTIFALKLTGIIDTEETSTTTNQVIDFDNENKIIEENNTPNTEENITIDTSKETTSIFANDTITSESNPTVKTIWNIINIVVILLIIPLLLRKYNSIISVIFLTIFKFIGVVLLNGFSAGFIPLLFVFIFLLIYSYTFLFFMEKLLLDASPIVFVVGTLFLEGFVYYITLLIFSFVLARLIV